MCFGLVLRKSQDDDQVGEEKVGLRMPSAFLIAINLSNLE